MANKKAQQRAAKKVGKAPKQAGDPNDQALAGLYGSDGVNAGNALINKFLKPGALGSVNTDIMGGQAGAQSELDRYGQLNEKYKDPSAEQQDVMARMKAGLGGYTSPEYQAQREQMQRGLNSNLATGQSNLARTQARAKVYGAAAGAQQQNLARSTQATKDNMEQDLYVKNIDEMRSRLGEYGKYGSDVRGQNFEMQSGLARDTSALNAQVRGETLDREKINLGQRNAETAAQIGAMTGAGASAMTQAQNRAAQKISRDALRAARS
jgi:hypothetical protein